MRNETEPDEEKPTFDEKMDEIEGNILEDHKQILRKEIPKMLKDPIYRPYMKDLVKHYKDDDIITDLEVKYFQGNIKMDDLGEEMDRVRGKKNRKRMLGGNRITIATGLNKAELLKQYEFGNATSCDPVNTLLVMKMDPEDFGYKVDEIDSRSLIQRRQALLSALKNVQVQKRMTEE